MPSESDATRRWLTDIAYHIAKAQVFAGTMSYEAFLEDDLRFYAVTRCLEIISEASRRLPGELKARHSTIPWQDMASSGNIYRHEYDNVAASRVWHTLTRSLPLLHDVIAQELAALGEKT